MTTEQVTLVITSCGRFELLEKTIISFFKYNTYPIVECIIVEDSGTIDNLDYLKEIIPVPATIIINEKNIGQIASIDVAYNKIKTPYIFHCEDDWEFYRSYFIEESFKILNNDPTVITVWLRNHADTMGHPIENTPMFHEAGHYFYLEIDYKGKWHGFTLNPGLRRMSDINKLTPYSKLAPLIRKKKQLILGEVDLSCYYYQLGYRGAITSTIDGYVRHIGYNAHIALPWEKNNAV
jgi:hypothetical protein